MGASLAVSVLLAAAPHAGELPSVAAGAARAAAAVGASVAARASPVASGSGCDEAYAAAGYPDYFPARAPALEAAARPMLAHLARVNALRGPVCFFVVDDPTPNAFAVEAEAGGGRVGLVVINKGLLSTLEDDSQLAGVLGHELAHLTLSHQRHFRVLSELVPEGWWARLIDPPFLRRRWLRGEGIKMEEEADRLGVIYAIRAGYEPLGAAAAIALVTERLEREALDMSGHPEPAKRVGDLEAAAKLSAAFPPAAAPVRVLDAAKARYAE